MAGFMAGSTSRAVKPPVRAQPAGANATAEHLSRQKPHPAAIVANDRWTYAEYDGAPHSASGDPGQVIASAPARSRRSQDALAPSRACQPPLANKLLSIHYGISPLSRLPLSLRSALAGCRSALHAAPAYRLVTWSSPFAEPCALGAIPVARRTNVLTRRVSLVLIAVASNSALSERSRDFPCQRRS